MSGANGFRVDPQQGLDDRVRAVAQMVQSYLLKNHIMEVLYPKIDGPRVPGRRSQPPS